jgi:hypothetical protein
MESTARLTESATSSDPDVGLRAVAALRAAIRQRYRQAG